MSAILIGVIVIAFVLIIGIAVAVWYFWKPKEEPKGCKTSADCSADQTCLNQLCVTKLGCSSDDDCGKDQVCDAAICVTPNKNPNACTSNSACYPDERCSAGRCVPIIIDKTKYYIRTANNQYLSPCDVTPKDSNVKVYQIGITTDKAKAGQFIFKTLNNNGFPSYEIYLDVYKMFVIQDAPDIVNILLLSKPGDILGYTTKFTIVTDPSNGAAIFTLSDNIAPVRLGGETGCKNIAAYVSILNKPADATLFYFDIV